MKRMVKLHLVGFTTDLKNLIFSRTRGAKSGTFLVDVDARLRRAVDEIARLESENNKAKSKKEVPPPRPPSKLTVREIQDLLRKGKSPQDVAKLAGTEVSWIERFTPPILAERAGVVDLVRAGYISKQRLGTSSVSVGEAVARNLGEKRVNLPPEEFDNLWNAVRRDGHWEVTFRFVHRGKRRSANFAYHPESREVRPLNEFAREIAWRQDKRKRKTTRRGRTPSR